VNDPWVTRAARPVVAHIRNAFVRSLQNQKMAASHTQFDIPDEQLQSLIQGLEHLISYELQYKANPNLPLEYDSLLSESYRQWKEYFTAHLIDPVAHQTLCLSLERARREDLRNYVQKTFLLSPSGGAEPETPLDQMLQTYVSVNSESLEITPPPNPAPPVMPTLIVEPDAEILRSQVRSLRKRIRELEEETHSLQERLAVKEGARSWDEIEQLVAEYERRAQEAEGQLEAALAQLAVADKPEGRDDGEPDRKTLEKRHQKTLVEVTSLASGMLNHLTTFLNDKACMVEPGEKVDPIRFAEFQAPLIQMVRKLKRIEEVSKLRCGVTEVTELINELFGEQSGERRS
jgi:hypothetical protein